MNRLRMSETFMDDVPETQLELFFNTVTEALDHARAGSPQEGFLALRYGRDPQPQRSKLERGWFAVNGSDR